MTKFLVADTEVKFLVYTRETQEAILGEDLLKNYKADFNEG